MGIYNPPPAGNGSGDMTKAVYDTNDDGKVNSAAVSDSANAVTWGNVTGKPSDFTPSTHSHAQADITNLVTDLAGKAASTHSHAISDTTGLQTALDGKQAAGSYAASSHTHAQSDITNLTTDLSAKQATLVSATNIKTINGATILGSGDLYPAISYASAFCTATTTISAATYADVTGASVSLAAGTWLIMAHVVCAFPNAIFQAFGAITHSDNTVIAESAISRPASGTASLNSPVSMTWNAIVTPGSTTTYKLRAARGLTTHTGNYTIYDGSGYNTANHATNNSDKGTSIIAIRIA